MFCCTKKKKKKMEKERERKKMDFSTGSDGDAFVVYKSGRDSLTTWRERELERPGLYKRVYLERNATPYTRRVTHVPTMGELCERP